MNFTRLQWLWAQFRRQLIYRAIIIGALSVVAALIALVVDGFVPSSVAIKMGSGAVDDLLSIIASSMLAVTTFSLSTVVAAYGSATSTATPRATNLLLDDTVSQNMLSTFIGAFIYSIVGIVLLKAGVYGTAGRLVLFIDQPGASRAGLSLEGESLPGLAREPLQVGVQLDERAPQRLSLMPGDRRSLDPHLPGGRPAFW